LGLSSFKFVFFVVLSSYRHHTGFCNLQRQIWWLRFTSLTVLSKPCSWAVEKRSCRCCEAAQSMHVSISGFCRTENYRESSFLQQNWKIWLLN